MNLVHLKDCLQLAFHDKDRPAQIVKALESANKELAVIHWLVCTRDEQNLLILALQPSTRPIVEMLVIWAKQEGLGYEAMEQALEKARSV